MHLTILWFMWINCKSYCIHTLYLQSHCTSHVLLLSVQNCWLHLSCSVLPCQGVLETVARRVTKKNETKDNKYVPIIYLTIFSLLSGIKYLTFMSNFTISSKYPKFTVIQSSGHSHSRKFSWIGQSKRMFPR